MYIDHILLASGGGFFIIASGLAIFLFFSRGREREYRRFLHQETERSDVVATMRQTYGVPAHGTAETHLDSETGAMTVIPEHKEGEIAQVQAMTARGSISRPSRRSMSLSGRSTAEG